MGDVIVNNHEALLVFGIVLFIVTIILSVAAGATWLRFRVDMKNKEQAQAALLKMKGIDAKKVYKGRFAYLMEPEPNLQKLGVQMPRFGWLAIRLGACLICAFILAVGLNNIVGAVIGVVIGLLAPRFIMKFLIKRRETKFAKQLSQALPMISENMRAGLTIEASITSVTRFMEEPFKSEFGIVCQEFAMTSDIAGALLSCAERLGNRDLEQLSHIVAIVRESGGNIADLLDIEAKHLEMRLAMRNHIKAITSQGRLQGILLSGLPFILLLLMCMLVEDPYRNFWMSGDLLSIGLLCGMAAFDGIGLWVMSKLYNIPIS